MITLDASALLALFNRADAHHAAAIGAIAAGRAPCVPSGILAAVADVLDARYGVERLDAFLADLQEGAYRLHEVRPDLPRIRALVRRYADLELGFADACVIACAERHGGRVMSFDRRDFDVVAREGTIVLVPG